MVGNRLVLVIDDDEVLRSLLIEQLKENSGIVACEAISLEEARSLFYAEGNFFDAVLLDVTLPDGDGRDFCIELRKNGHAMPIIMLTGSDEEDDIVSGLDAGANDYVVKPFRIGELLARLRAQLRIFDNSEDVVFTIGPYIFRPSAKLMIDNARKRRVHLTEKETSILKFLYRSGRKPVGRHILLNEVWGHNSNVMTHTLETHIYRLRQKIEPDPAHVSLLVTEGGGYCLRLEER